MTETTTRATQTESVDESALGGKASRKEVTIAVVTPKAIGGFQSLNGGTIQDGVYTLKASTRYISGTSSTTFDAGAAGCAYANADIALSAITQIRRAVFKDVVFTARKIP